MAGRGAAGQPDHRLFARPFSAQEFGEAFGQQADVEYVLVADAQGRVDLASSSPLPGSSYEGADVRGLLWSMKQQPGAIDKVFLTGGTSFIPAIRRLFAERFGEDRLVTGAMSVLWTLKPVRKPEA